jgi:hypothetical protein
MAKNDIPKKAFLDAQILLHPRMRSIRGEIASSLERAYDLPIGALGDGNFLEVRVLSLLYLLIVYPKEFWELEPNSPQLARLEDVFDLSAMNVEWGRRKFPEHGHYELIHRVRNAVSHARVTFSESGIFLTDRNGFKLSLSVDEMSCFLSSVGAFLANATPSSIH